MFCLPSIDDFFEKWQHISYEIEKVALNVKYRYGCSLIQHNTMAGIPVSEVKARCALRYNLIVAMPLSLQGQVAASELSVPRN